MMIVTPKTTRGFDYFWRYAAARQEIYWQKVESRATQTTDPILATYRFTNVYRACDRVSQYLINEIQYDQAWSWTDTFVRTLVFKLFNKIETWQFLNQRIRPIDQEALLSNKIRDSLRQLAQRSTLYNPAYVMPPPPQFGGQKFERHLELLKLMLFDGAPAKIKTAKNMEEGFNVLKNYPSIGAFLAYQLITDLNYCPHLNFSESEFTVAGPGSLKGLRKCFETVTPRLAPALIQWTAQRQDVEFRTRELPWRNLYGRPLKLIDIQNIFCELDKYTRRIEDFSKTSASQRPKQFYKPSDQALTSVFPAKWSLNLGANQA